MNTIAVWFTDARRQAIQAAIGTLLVFVAYFGWVSGPQIDAVLSVSQVALQLAQGIVGLALLRRSDAARWLNTTGRGLVYALAGVVGPLGVAFRWWGDETAGQILTIVGLALTMAAAFVQIVNVQTLPLIDAGNVDDGIPIITSLPDPSTSSRETYQSALGRTEEN